MDNQKLENKNYKKKLNIVSLSIFIISFTIIFLVNIIYYSSGVEFNTENFLTLLPINLIGLSLTLYCVLIIIYNVLRLLTNYK